MTTAAHVALIGRRDHGRTWYGHDALRASGILDLPHDAVRKAGPAGTAAAVLDRLARDELAGFWIHFDADVLDPGVMPAVDSPEPGGLGLDEAAALLTPAAGESAGASARDLTEDTTTKCLNNSGRAPPDVLA